MIPVTELASGRARTTRADDLVCRPARADEIDECAGVWRASINHYIGRLGQDEIPAEMQHLVRLLAHLQITDPERFMVALAPEESADRIVAFGSAIVRERLWYLSMLFVLPGFQAAGLGRRLMGQLLPSGVAVVRATATDSAQPISNALYASIGMAPRMPLFNLTGLPERPAAFGSLPSGVVPIAFETIAGGAAGGAGHQELAAAVDAIDREVLGAAHPIDHRFLRTERRSGWIYHGPGGAPLGYGYASEAGRLGPVAARDAALVAPILGHLTSAVVPRGAFSTWIGGAADRALAAALSAGFRLDRFPLLLCWDRPFADFGRYLPISPGLL